MPSEEAVVKLTNAILLSALKRGAEQVLIRPGTVRRCVVEFSVQGVLHVELQPPADLLAPIVQRLSDIADLPSYSRGDYAIGTIHLTIGAHRHEYFGIVVAGHSTSLTATITVLTARYTNATTRRRNEA